MQKSGREQSARSKGARLSPLDLSHLKPLKTWVEVPKRVFVSFVSSKTKGPGEEGGPQKSSRYFVSESG